MNNIEKKALYDRFCAAMTNWEHPQEAGLTEMEAANGMYEAMVEVQNNWDDLFGPAEPRIYVGRYDLLEGGVEEVEEFTEDEAKEEMIRQRAFHPNDKRIDTYTLEELEAEINNDLDEDEPFSLNYWVRIF